MQKSYYSKNDPVSIVPLDEYSREKAREALTALLSPLGGLDFVKHGMNIIIKANLVSAMKPDEAATTHPVLLSALCEMLLERGASVVVGDSPGGLYNKAFVGRVYNATGMRELEGLGVKLNDDFGESSAEYPEGRVLRSFTYTSYLDKADFIINFCISNCISNLSGFYLLNFF